MTSSVISVRPGSSKSTSMTAKRALSALTRRTPRRSCPLPESVVTTDTRIFSRKLTPTTTRLPGFSFTRSLECPYRYYLHYYNEPRPVELAARSGQKSRSIGSALREERNITYGDLLVLPCVNQWATGHRIMV